MAPFLTCSLCSCSTTPNLGVASHTPTQGLPYKQATAPFPTCSLRSCASICSCALCTLTAIASRHDCRLWAERRATAALQRCSQCWATASTESRAWARGELMGLACPWDCSSTSSLYVGLLPPVQQGRLVSVCVTLACSLMHASEHANRQVQPLGECCKVRT